ncbi:MAG: hypothetical protein Q8P61_01965 [Candidatus Nanopelagicales bacterium]|nr:hypothetical protein [Candidatus Nanopelagicales bacterium]
MSRQPPPGLTVTVGPEQFFVERAVNDVVEQARALDPEVEVRRIDASVPGAAGLVDQACSPTLFGASSVVVVAEVEAGEESVARAIVAAAELADPGLWIVACHQGGQRGKKIRDILTDADALVVECPEIKRGRAMSEFATAELRLHGKSAGPDALSLLIATRGADARSLASACAQLASDVEEKVISVDDVRTYFGSSADVAGYQIADAVLWRKPDEALRLLRAAELGDGGAIGPSTVAAMVRGLRQLVKLRSVPPGSSDRDVAIAVGVPTWRLRSLGDQARRWHPREVAAAVLILADADAAMKGGIRQGTQLDPAQKLLQLERTITRLARPTGTDQT